MSYFTDPAQQWTLELDRAKAQQDMGAYSRIADDPNFMNNLAEYALRYPQGSAALGLALSQGGIPASDPSVQQYVNTEIANRGVLGPVDEAGDSWSLGDPLGPVDDKVVTGLKGAVRWGFAAWEAGYNLIAGGAPIRARELASDEDISFGDAWKRQDPYFFEALGGLISGERVNLGSGWFPNSDVADDVTDQVQLGMQQVEQDTMELGANDRMRTRLEAAPDIWNQAVAGSLEQKEMGAPLTQLNYADVESVMFDVNPWTGGNTVQTPWSPGRMLAANLVEPGTEPYRKISGTGDFMSQVFLDPVDWVGGAWAKTGVAGRRIWGLGKAVTEQADEVATAARVMGLRGGVDEFASEAEAAGRVLTSKPMMELPMPEQLAALTGDMSPQVGLPGRTVFVGEEGKKVPWWRSSEAKSDRVANAYDPPDWYIEQARNQRSGALEGWTGKSRRVVNGAYEIDLPRLEGQQQQVARIFRRGSGKEKYWDVTMPDGSRLPNVPDDPRFDVLGTRFNTKAQAEDAVRRNAQAQGSPGFDDLSVHGMSEDEFLNSFEDVYLQDDIRFLKGQPSAVTNEPFMHRTGTAKPSSTKSRGNARVRVYGKSLDLSSGLADDLPEGLKDALRADRKLRGNQLVGFGDPQVEKFDATLRWMDENGYGKLDWDEDTVLISDRMVGGNTGDRQMRMWFEDGNKPMMSPLDDLASPTPNEINDVIRQIVDEANVYAGPGKVTDPGLVGQGFDIPSMASTGAHKGAVGEVAGEGFKVPSMSDEFARSLTPIEEFLRTASDDVLARLDKKFLEEKFGEVSDDILERIRKVMDENVGDPDVLPGARPDFDPDYQLKGKKADMFADRIAAVADAGDAAKLDRLLRFATQLGVPVPNSVKRRLLGAKSREEVKKIFGEWLVKEGGQEMILPGGRQYGRLAGVMPAGRDVGIASKMPSWASRRFSNSVGGTDVNMVEDPSAAYQLFDRVMPQYNIRRGAETTVDAYDDAGKVIGEIDVEDIFTDLRNMDEGDKGMAYNVMGRFSEAMFSSLVGDGVDPKLARRSSRWWLDNEHMANFDAERFGRIDLGSSPYDMGLVNGELIGGVGTQLTADLWTGQLKPVDPRTMKRISNESDLLGKIANSMSWKQVEGDTGNILLQDRVVSRFLDATITKIWKPLVLLRGAWTLRILMDDQLRMVAEGYSMFNHPFRVMGDIIANTGEWKKILSGGTVDVFGTAMKLDEVTNMQHADRFIAAMMRTKDPNFGPGAYGSRMHVSQGKDNMSKYTEGLVFEAQHLRGSPMTKVLANSKSDDPVAETVRWLMGDGRKGLPDPTLELRNQAELHNKMEGVAEKILARDPEVLHDIVSRQNMILHNRLGGKVALDNGNGQLLNFNELTGYGKEGGEATGKAKWIVEERADSDLLDWVAGNDEVAGRFIGDAATEDSRKMLQGLFGEKVKENPNFPQAVRRPNDAVVGQETKNLSQQLDTATRRMFDIFMAFPSDTLSRAPEFRRAYWGKMEELAPYMDEALRAKVAKNAPNPDRILKPKGNKAAGIEGQLTDLDQADLFAKSHGLTMVERTLFTLTDRKNISDSARLFFPFGEAWGEFITRWGRLMVTGDKNVKNLNRLRQSVSGARRSGTFTENEYGNETFAYPAFLNTIYAKAHDTLNNLPGGEKFLGADVGQYMENIETRGSVESLNFASGVIPGFGPVFQIAARQLPQNPDYDWIRDLVAPFGTEGNLGHQFLPAWLKRLSAAHGGADDPQLTYQYNSTVMDIMRTKIDQGEFAGVTSEAEINALVREAESEAKGILVVRAAATYLNPSSPQYKFQKEDTSGMVWSYNNLGQAYYELQQEFGEEDAFNKFYERFGFLPQAFTGGKTYSVVDRSRTEEGGRFERSHTGLFEDYPSIAMYLDPNIAEDSPYDHDATLRQLDQGLRESWTAEQFAYIQQDQLGDIWWERVQSVAAGFPKGSKDRKDAYLASQRQTITEQYPFWNKPIPGKAQAVTNEQQREELLRAIEDSRVSDLAVVNPIRIYEDLREQVLAQIREAGASTIDGPKSTTSDAGRIATYGRNWLREKAAELEMEYPQFGPLFQYIYYSEVSEHHDAIQPIDWNLYDEGDIFEETYGVTANG